MSLVKEKSSSDRNMAPLSLPDHADKKVSTRNGGTKKILPKFDDAKRMMSSNSKVMPKSTFTTNGQLAARITVPKQCLASLGLQRKGLPDQENQSRGLQSSRRTSKAHDVVKLPTVKPVYSQSVENKTSSRASNNGQQSKGNTSTQWKDKLSKINCHGIESTRKEGFQKDSNNVVKLPALKCQDANIKTATKGRQEMKHNTSLKHRGLDRPDVEIDISRKISKDTQKENPKMSLRHKDKVVKLPQLNDSEAGKGIVENGQLACGTHAKAKNKVLSNNKFKTFDQKPQSQNKNSSKTMLPEIKPAPGDSVKPVKKKTRPLVDYVECKEPVKVKTKEQLAKFNAGNGMAYALYGTPPDSTKTHAIEISRCSTKDDLKKLEEVCEDPRTESTCVAGTKAERINNTKKIIPLVDYVQCKDAVKVKTKEKLARFNSGNSMAYALYGTPPESPNILAVEISHPITKGDLKKLKEVCEDPCAESNCVTGTKAEYSNKKIRPLVDYVECKDAVKVKTKEKLVEFNSGSKMSYALHGTPPDSSIKTAGRKPNQSAKNISKEINKISKDFYNNKVDTRSILKNFNSGNSIISTIYGTLGESKVPKAKPSSNARQNGKGLTPGSYNAEKVYQNYKLEKEISRFCGENPSLYDSDLANQYFGFKDINEDVLPDSPASESVPMQNSVPRQWNNSTSHDGQHFLPGRDYFEADRRDFQEKAQTKWDTSNYLQTNKVDARSTLNNFNSGNNMANTIYNRFEDSYVQERITQPDKTPFTTKGHENIRNESPPFYEYRNADLNVGSNLMGVANVGTAHRVPDYFIDDSATRNFIANRKKVLSGRVMADVMSTSRLPAISKKHSRENLQKTFQAGNYIPSSQKYNTAKRGMNGGHKDFRRQKMPGILPSLY
ncbi:hypothetical protein JTE90_019465 [Oedothorax gibbosus]|uniref:Uncharacterized protein n=1 Tax=Oedothorax gibbosus TaxID=931172 RepID=A0AAV6UV20_9ARAC|nr:hypothetical protein JTE90_019465 [Oedothorax gibbosus]